MIHHGRTILVTLAEVLACAAAPVEKGSSQPAEEGVTVVAEVKYYVTGVTDQDEMQLFKTADPKRMWKVSGFIFEVIQPPEYAGQIIGMHHDGVLASGDPYKPWEVGRRYEFKISKQNIGKLSFGPCSLGGARKELPK